ncbi:monovalent cation:H+ antiporter, CPA1 family [Kaistia soli DSM 19436]|uniref:Monovalent cation:H+ antiporter, CPA1 family n=1 Tax=Kaistia soli DSM 19436 TaxID=1122133 RepID=A0A1M5IQJ3_9HYPH|nr:sodium:proton antiporter [Kaistia soli]SHG30240.1 monovalent cation:H+ antiporter, CPA1 family [Kaistia soli DSM 19436]
MLTSFDYISLLFVLAAGIGLINERFGRLPRVIALLIGSLVVSFGMIAASWLTPHIHVAARTGARLANADLSDVLLDGVLALLLFATSLTTDAAGLRRRARPIFLLVTFGVVIAMVIFAFGIQAVLAYAGFSVPLAWCLVLGAILAPTDAVAVEQLLAKVKMPSEIRDLITGESLFNDGAAVVLYFAALATATGDEAVVGHGRLLLTFLVDGGGGALLGFATGLVARFAMQHIREEHLVVTISLALVFATYRMAALLELSGPIAVVVAGLTLSHFQAKRDLDAIWRRRIHDFWSMVDEIVNTLLFMLMGFEILEIPIGAAGFWPVLAAIPLSILARFVSVAVPLALGHRPHGETARAVGVLTWTGLRGGISIALVLALPDSPYRETLTAICYTVVIFSVIVQGLSTPAVVRRVLRARN